mmetsp:Transcript_8488/g.21876  ORF Transcript_8488/g.21876 Transcript_8488/m.21876 type:complete len:259 (-) Transcript_8488:494-1270(-)
MEFRALALTRPPTSVGLLTQVVQAEHASENQSDIHERRHAQVEILAHVEGDSATVGLSHILPCGIEHVENVARGAAQNFEATFCNCVENVPVEGTFNASEFGIELAFVGQEMKLGIARHSWRCRRPCRTTLGERHVVHCCQDCAVHSPHERLTGVVPSGAADGHTQHRGAALVFDVQGLRSGTQPNARNKERALAPGRHDEARGKTVGTAYTACVFVRRGGSRASGIATFQAACFERPRGSTGLYCLALQSRWRCGLR